MPPHTLPPQLATTITAVFGERGAAWISDFPRLLADCERRWSLTVLPPFRNLSYNYVAPAVLDNATQAVIKLGVPSREMLTEIAALQHYGGRGSARLLAANAERGALLLERLRPGTTLFELADDTQAISIAAQVMRQLWRPPPPDHTFPSVQDWANGLQRLRTHFDGGTGPFPIQLVERAEQLFQELLASSAAPVLLHGDLHHWNILAATRAPWLAIDPKGIIGEPAYEVGALLRNPMPQILSLPHPQRILARRLDQLAEELGFDRARLASWATAQAVLSAWWSIEDGDDGWSPMLACAELLARL